MAVHLYGKTCQEEVVNQSQVLTSIIRVSLITDLDYRGDFDSKILFRLLSAFVCR
jgi:predicted secreted protein